jgi:hypothetical protein
MQNSAVAIPPDRPKAPERKPSVPDFSLEPLPVPDATESNTDTAWGLWEHSLKSNEDTRPADLQDFPDTEHAGLAPVERKKP